MINIIDAMCGMGKTSAAINYINLMPADQRFLYVTPYLEEVKRIIHACPERRFVQPENRGGKLRDIKRLFSRGRNIVSTHALFHMFDQEVIDILLAKGYTLIMDEVTNVVDQLEISVKDTQDILTNYSKVRDDGLVEWVDADYTGEFDRYRKMIESGSVYSYSDNVLIWMLPIEIFKAFDDVYILTYMFDAQAQRYYYDLSGVEYKYIYVAGDSPNNYHFTDDVVKYDLSKYSTLINIAEQDKLNRVGEAEYSLSKGWYERNASNDCMNILKHNLNNYFRNIVGTPSSMNLWTTFSDYRSALAGKGYAKGFVAQNMRATNAYRERSSLAYTVNRYMSPVIKQFFEQKDVRVEEDAYALSELIQWIFRGCIRDDKPIELYIPSKRMRGLLKGWIQCV